MVFLRSLIIVEFLEKTARPATTLMASPDDRLFQTSNLMGASLGTAALSTVAVAVTAHATDPKTTAAIAHGYAIASACATGVLLAGALFIALFLRGSRYVDYGEVETMAESAR
ncbi:MAG TPA: hypothetical protein VJ870_15270 [Amycolatopsis sp.]|nr:hypothetical protein [Amycolatopsis sp.]